MTPRALLQQVLHEVTVEEGCSGGGVPMTKGTFNPLDWLVTFRARAEMAVGGEQTDLEEAAGRLNEFVTVAREIVDVWEQGDLAGAVRRLVEWSELTEEWLEAKGLRSEVLDGFDE
jgi:hypothetical protein